MFQYIWFNVPRLTYVDDLTTNTRTNLNNQVIMIYKNLPVTPCHPSTPESITTEALPENNVGNNIDRLLMTTPLNIQNPQSQDTSRGREHEQVTSRNPEELSNGAV